MESNNKRTLVIGASTNPERYSNKAIQMLREYNHDVVALAKRTGNVDDVTIQTDFPDEARIHTVTLYIGATRQPEYYEHILKLNPQRVIFNPGTENSEFKKMLESKSIETVEGCTLVMLRTNQF
ncbi:hypothetical protein SAMN05444274_103200 [Mariniphaga anaerophila]|uniref:CoA-binding domain-containing protein n=1 Tax=Mariniphaga anaerophila TaxID=1484053 RepID=A0A1M4Y1W1_9BACT|nr:CoA-binding protein [Mariniphaga anaerophila]SHE99668.1 hypothetical protein SAMN05444274_103200 [Mariniphaga anaerophila]